MVYFAPSEWAYLISSEQTKRRVRFGAFEADLQAGELRKHDTRIRLQDQPFQILALLLSRPGDVVTREELRQRLWPSDTFVDFDHGLNNAVNRLREALSDSPDRPRYIETLPKRGYRLIPPVETVPTQTLLSTVAQAPSLCVEPQPAASQLVTAANSTIWPLPSARVIALALVLLFAFAASWIGLRAWRQHARSVQKADVSQIRSLAVLPLDNLSGDPEQEYFADGMTDALITDLAQIGALRVISRTSSMQYKHTRKLLPQIGRELSVDAVVEGTVTRSGNHVRIDAQLIRADTDQHLWANSYEGDLSHIIALQGEVAAAISRQVRVTLSPQDRKRLSSQSDVSPEAYELYLRGNSFLETRTQDGMKKALTYYQEAADKDPSFALAWAGVADSYGLLCSFGFLPENEAVPKARAAAERAESLDGSSAEVLTALAGSAGSPAQVEAAFRRAIQVNPSYALAHHWYARFLSDNRRFDEALVEIRKARLLDPLSVRIVVNEGEILFLAGQRDQALHQFQLALSMDPNFPLTHWALGRSLFYARQYDAALAHLQKAVETSPNFPGSHYWLAVVEEYLGKCGQAIAEFQKADILWGMNPAEASARASALGNALSRNGENGYWREWIALHMKDRKKAPHAYAYKIAYDYTQLKENAKAIGWLETCHREGTCGTLDIRFDPGLDSLRSDPRFPSLLQRWGVAKQ